MSIGFSPHFLALFFGSDDIAHAKQQREQQQDLALAWAWLDAPDGAQLGTRPAPTAKDPDATAPILKPTLTGLAAAHVAALRFRLLGDHEAGSRALAALTPPSADAPLLVRLMDALTWLDCGTLLHEHPDRPAAWADHARGLLAELLAAAPSGALEQLWQDVLRMAGSIVLDDDASFAASLAAYRAHIARIHPEGYIKPMITGEDADTLRRQLLATQGLVLMAEMAHQAGASLWAYQDRGISIATAASYCVYYYFFPEQWKWYKGLAEDEVRALYTAHGAFFEMAQRRTTLLGKATEKLLEEQRPYYCPQGGLTTLTHGVPLPPRPAPKKRRWFWQRA